MNDNNSHEQFLSAAGAQRRDAILQAATAAMTKHHRMRRRKRVVLAGLLLALVCGSAIVYSQFPLYSSTATAERVAKNDKLAPTLIETPVAPTHESVVSWQVVQSDSSALERYTVRDGPTIEHVDDAGLARFLDSINRPAGVISTGGQVRLTRNVIDAVESDKPASPM